MEELLISIEATGRILTVCAKGECETGGISVGLINYPDAITDIISSTVFAERQTHTYYQTEKDVEFLNKRLQKYQTLGYDFNGYFHRHPRGLTTLSSGDIRTCKEILQSPNYKINNRLIMLIIAENKDCEFPIHSYIVSLSSLNKVVVKKATLKFMSKSRILSFVASANLSTTKTGEVQNERNHTEGNSGKANEKSRADKLIRPLV